MPAVFEEVLAKEINSGNFSPVYILFGEDSYLKKYYSDKICNNAYDGDPFFNLQKFDGDASLQDVYDAVVQFPMMSSKKCVLLSDYDFEHASKNDFDKLCELLSSENDTTVFVLKFDTLEFDHKRSARAKKIISAAESVKGKAVCLDHRKTASLVKTLCDGALKRNCKMSTNVSNYLIETVGEDLSLLRNELDKLCSYVKEGKIEKKDVDLVCIKSVEASVYDYVKMILAGNASGALKLLDDMFYMHIEPMVILYTAAASYVDIYRVFCGQKSGVNISQIAKEFGYKNRAFVLERAANGLKKLDLKRLNLSFETLLETDKKLKSFGCDERLVLEQMTVRLIFILVRGTDI